MIRLSSLSFVPVALAAITLVGCGDADDGGEVIPVSPGHYDDIQAAEDNALPSFSHTTKIEGLSDESNSAREFGGRLRIQLPSDWVEVERTPIQRTVLLAKYEITGTKIEVRVSNTGGGIDGNFDRWKGQFTGGSSSEESVGYSDRDARVLMVTGDFHPGFGRPDEPDSMLLGAALSSSPDDYYIKLTGPRAEVAKVVDQFKATIKTASFFR